MNLGPIPWTRQFSSVPVVTPMQGAAALVLSKFRILLVPSLEPRIAGFSMSANQHEWARPVWSNPD